MRKLPIISILISFTFLLILAVYLVDALNGQQANGFNVVLIILFMICLLLYFLPTYVVYRREHHALLPIFITNLFLGWTFLGWVASLIWACTQVQKRYLTLGERALIEQRVADQLDI